MSPLCCCVSQHCFAKYAANELKELFFLSLLSLFFLLASFPLGSPRVIIRFCARAFLLLISNFSEHPSSSFSITPSYFRILVPLWSRLLQAFLYPLRFYATMFYRPYAHLLSCPSPHLLSSRVRFAFISVNSIFSFSRAGTANPSLLHFRIWVLPSTNRGSPPFHCYFFITLSLPRAKLLYLPRVSV